MLGINSPVSLSALTSYYAWMFDILGHYDLPDLVAALAPLPVLFVNPVDANLTSLTNNTRVTMFAFAQQYYQAMGAREKLIVESNPTPPQTINSRILGWLGPALATANTPGSPLSRLESLG